MKPEHKNTIINAVITATPFIVVIENLIFRKNHHHYEEINTFLGYTFLIIIGAIVAGTLQHFKLKNAYQEEGILLFGIYVNVVIGILILLVGPVL